MQNRVFFPQAALDQWIVDGVVELQRGELTLLTEGRRYAIIEAVHVLREVSGAGDAAEIVDRVKTVASLEELGAELVEGSMLLGDAAYDVVPGWSGAPIESLSMHLAAEARKRGPGGKGMTADVRTEEELLARFLARTG
jgi:hypothetical protein